MTWSNELQFGQLHPSRAAGTTQTKAEPMPNRKESVNISTQER
jgi:hypothetical protein